ncbi:MAG: ribonuclease III [Candidatus Vogelbacteria bacterium CG10_big_fil_rev_8_21_14_0_10_50_13]|uniref:Ribonuclease 3 n=1 Tax=Candidatus Vogelbacteria bacterium CG10_big_fil_rev_8_21_14_0_10_50_13 TaxID=1975044 RepID=A0A2H0RGN3_9BACT|nr:MAG: ribonuclease III [Candidatus Vogelbacteria bacterium CG10_big_fil_rev_8_21_14_0_10_50_13]
MKSISEFASQIGINFIRPELLEQAFVHRSYINEHRDYELEHNERLEFLGDAVLELVVTDYLFGKYPERSEGELTSFRAALVNTVTLSETADALKLNDYLLLSKGEARDNGRARQAILADTFEAVIGAIYLDQGYASARDFIARQLFGKTEEIVKKNLWHDPKSVFQEKAQENMSITPSYQVMKAVGPDHNKLFTIGLYLADELVAEGEGHSKQEAEQEAAQKGLAAKGWMVK